MQKVRITFIDSNKKQQTVEAPIGATIMQVAVKHAIPGILAECGGCCLCGTCHVYVPKEWEEKLGLPHLEEKDTLDFVNHRSPHSRLSCQMIIQEDWDGLTLFVPGI